MLRGAYTWSVRYRMIVCAAITMLMMTRTDPLIAQVRPVWTASWMAAPTPPLAVSPTVPKAALARAFDGQTISQIVRLSAGGSALRLRLTNEYGGKPLIIGAATVAMVDRAGLVIPGTERRLTFAGRPEVTIPAGAPWTSDNVDMAVPSGGRLQVRLFFPGDTGLCTCHPAGGQTAMTSSRGDFTARPFSPVDTFSARAFIAGIDVRSVNAVPVTVAFGDSITDGYRSSLDADHRWPDRLVDRLARRHATRGYGVVNAGISGNRLLADGAITLFGQNALARFDRDVLSVSGVRTVIVLLGINDIGQGLDRPPTADAIIAGLRQLIDRAHAKQIRVIGGTLLPYEGAAYFRPSGDAVRRSVNGWIRGSGAFDDVIDFDAVMRDPAHPGRLRPELQSGDWLHPNDRGYELMGSAVNLRSLR